MTEFTQTDPVTGGSKNGKLAEFAMIPPDVLWEIAELFGIGVQKYGHVNGRANYQAGYPWSWSYSAMQRHLWQYWSGEDLDAESGKHHLTHAAWHCMALLWFTLHEAGTDDRPV